MSWNVLKGMSFGLLVTLLFACQSVPKKDKSQDRDPASNSGNYNDSSGKVIDLGLTTPKEVKADVKLWDAGHGPSILPSQGVVKQQPTLTIKLAARKLNTAEAALHWDNYYRFNFYKHRIVSQDEVVRLAKQGEVFCSLQILTPKSFKGKVLKIKTASDKVDTGSKGMTFSKEVEDSDNELRAQQYYTHLFNLSGFYQGNKEVKTPAFFNGSCSTPKGNEDEGRRVVIGDIYENIPDVIFYSDYPEHQK